MDTLALLASLAILGYSAFYTLMCAAFPFGHCRRCKGTAKLYSPTSIVVIDPAGPRRTAAERLGATVFADPAHTGALRVILTVD